jgi:hypothetical protein
VRGDHGRSDGLRRRIVRLLQALSSTLMKELRFLRTEQDRGFAAVEPLGDAENTIRIIDGLSELAHAS